MPKKEEVEEVLEWCKKKRAESTRPYIIERNPFSDKFDWMRRFALIEIDRPKQIASKTSLVYDSTTKTIYQYINGEWMEIRATTGL